MKFGKVEQPELIDFTLPKITLLLKLFYPKIMLIRILLFLLAAPNGTSKI